MRPLRLSIDPDGKWHLGHDHAAGDGTYEGPTHVRCNVGERNKRVASGRRRKEALRKSWDGWMGVNGEHWSRQWLREGTKP